MLFVLALDHIEMFSYVFVLYGHGKLDLKFVNGKAEIEIGSNKICPEKVYTLEAEIAKENSRPQGLEKKGCLVADTFTLIKESEAGEVQPQCIT